jgi:hypothetical protein
MFLIFVYVFSVITWGIVLFDLGQAVFSSIKYKTDTPKLLIPLAFVSLALVVENGYFLVANIVRYFIDPAQYALFVQQDNLFLVKIGIAVSGFLMVLMMRSDKKTKIRG